MSIIKSYRKVGLATKILVAMIIGAVLGFIFKGSFDAWSKVTTPIGDVFIRLLKMTILPLIFFSIVAGIASIADLKRLKKVGGTFVVYWFFSSLVAAAMGIIWAYIIKPGIGIQLAEKEKFTTEGVDLLKSLIQWIPDNAAGSFANFNIIQVIVFALFIGIAVALIGKTEAGQVLSKFFDSCNNLMARVIEIVMGFAPIGVLCLMANVTGSLGQEVLTGLGKMLITQYVAYATVLVIVYPIILKLIAKVNPLQHYVNIFPAMVLAFSTCSSNATLPLTMKCSKERAGVPADTVHLIAPPAATINMHAVCAEMPIYAIFAAQMFGIEFNLGSLIVICFLGVIMAAGVAGVPGGGIIMSAVMMQVMGLPLTIVPWVAGIYRLIDMPNTMLNITGDTVGMVVTSSIIGDLDRDTFNAKKTVYKKDMGTGISA